MKLEAKRQRYHVAYKITLAESRVIVGSVSPLEAIEAANVLLAAAREALESEQASKMRHELSRFLDDEGWP